MKLHSLIYLDRAIVDNCTSPYAIFEKLEMKGHIGIGNYEILKDLLKAADLVNVSKMVEEMEKDIPPDTKPATLYPLQRELKEWYWDNMKRIQPLPMCEWEELDLKHIFTNLQVVEGKKHRLTDSSKKQSSRPFDDPEIVDRIFKVTPSERNICFIEGPAGIGKSTLCRQFAYLWSKDDYKIHGHHFDLVGILEARSLTEDFRKSLVQQLFPEDFQIPEDEICPYFQEGKSLLIIDGVDELTAYGEWAITQLLGGRFFRNVHLIITGRPESARKFLPYAKLHLEVKGFSVMNAIEYICKYFKNDEKNYEKRLLDRIRYGGDLSELVVNPFVTLLLCSLVQEKSEIPSNVSEIYHEVMWTICRKYVKKLQEQGDRLLDEKMLYSAARYVAYTGVGGNVFVFPENYLNSLCEGDLGFHLLKSGILSKDFSISRFHSNEFCYFPHRSFQEFFCGSYLEKLGLDEFKKEVLPLLPISPAALPLEHPVLECLRYFPSTQVDKTKIVLEHLLEIVAHGKTESIDDLYYRWIETPLDYLCKAYDRLDLVDFFRKQFNRSFKVARVLYYAVDTGIISKPFEDQVQLAICKMDLPPVTDFLGGSNSHITEISPKMKLWFKMDTYVAIKSRYFQPNSRLLEAFTKLNGVKMPFILCCSIRDASVCLKKLSRLGVLTITVTQYSLKHVVDLQAFQKDLTSVENKINIVFVFLEARYDDSRFLNFISLVKGYSSDKVKIQVITFKPFDTEEEIPFPGVSLVYLESLHRGFSHFFHLYHRLDYDHWHTTTDTNYGLPRPLHRECYDRFCPY